MEIVAKEDLNAVSSLLDQFVQANYVGLKKLNLA